VLGYLGYGNDYEGYAVPALWEDGVAVELNALIPAGWGLSDVGAINDQGWILATIGYWTTL